MTQQSRPKFVAHSPLAPVTAYPIRMSAAGPGCVKTRLSQGRAELFSQLPSPNRSCQCNRFSTTTKSRRKFYAQVQRRSFHTAWVRLGHCDLAEGCPFCPQEQTLSDRFG